jgi:hypothetical protein
VIVDKDTKGFKSRSDSPDKNFTDNENVFILEDGSDLANKIMHNYPYFEFVLDLEGNLVNIIPTQKPPIALQEIKENKIIELNTLCNQEILGGFPSSATGTEHQYKFDMEYQGNFSQQGVMLTLDPTIETVMWPTSDAGVIPHTREQFIQLCKDAQNWKGTNIYRYFAMKAQIEATTTPEEVALFVW